MTLKAVILTSKHKKLTCLMSLKVLVYENHYDFLLSEFSNSNLINCLHLILFLPLKQFILDS